MWRLLRNEAANFMPVHVSSKVLGRVCPNRTAYCGTDVPTHGGNTKTTVPKCHDGVAEPSVEDKKIPTVSTWVSEIVPFVGKAQHGSYCGEPIGNTSHTSPSRHSPHQRCCRSRSGSSCSRELAPFAFLNSPRPPAQFPDDQPTRRPDPSRPARTAPSVPTNARTSLRLYAHPSPRNSSPHGLLPSLYMKRR